MHSNDQALLDSADEYLSRGESPCSDCGRSARLEQHPVRDNEGLCSDCLQDALTAIDAVFPDDCDEDLAERAEMIREATIAARELEAANDNGRAKPLTRLDRIMAVMSWK
jgi:hypothetical protein